MKTRISKNELVAEKFGILRFCINCNKIISITNDEADFKMFNTPDKNLWIHDETKLRACYAGKLLYAFPRIGSKQDGIEN